MTSNRRSKWYYVRHGTMRSAFDDEHVVLYSRHVLGEIIDDAWLSTWGALEATASRLGDLVGKIHSGWGDKVYHLWYEGVNKPLQWAAHRFPEVNEFVYPVVDEVAKSYYALIGAHEMSTVMVDHDKDPEHGTPCPRCGTRNINPWNVESIQLNERCLHCVVREGSYHGLP